MSCVEACRLASHPIVHLHLHGCRKDGVSGIDQSARGSAIDCYCRVQRFSKNAQHKPLINVRNVRNECGDTPISSRSTRLVLAVESRVPHRPPDRALTHSLLKLRLSLRQTPVNQLTVVRTPNHYDAKPLSIVAHRPFTIVTTEGEGQPWPVATHIHPEPPCTHLRPEARARESAQKAQCPTWHLRKRARPAPPSLQPITAGA